MAWLVLTAPAPHRRDVALEVRAWVVPSSLATSEAGAMTVIREQHPVLDVVGVAEVPDSLRIKPWT